MKRKGKKLIGGLQSVLITRLFIVLIVLSISRFILFVFNNELFSPVSFGEIISAYIFGWRFDLVTLSIFAILLILANTLPLPFRKNAIYQRVINSLSLFAFSIAILFNCIDVIYYRFTLKRMTFDIFTLLESNDGFINLLPSFLIDFWHVSLVTVLLIFLLVFLFNKVELKPSKEKFNWKFFARNTAYFIVWAGLIIMGIRGGTQLIPIGIVDASLHVKPRFVPVVLNTPFTIIKSFGQEGLTELKYYNEEELKEIFNPIKSYNSPIKSEVEGIENVVVIILESISSEHIGYLSNEKSFTPFLDSLFAKSLSFKGTANGKRSIEGIPAILSGLPTLSDESFINGPYAMNQIEGLANTLSQKGYQTAFFHGGKNGTMSFDAYAKSAGFDAYYGLNEYPNKDDYDGHWGIWDEEYLKYFANTVSTFKEPFFATVFTLSSHHPYSIPEKYIGKFAKGDLEIQEAISYTDLSLKKYFEEVRKKDWYERTLFVITADHTSEGASDKYRNRLGQYGIPIAFFAPGDSLLSLKSERTPVQQSDIFPSVIDYLGYEDSILCFGNSIFSSNDHPFAVNYYNNTLQVLDSMYLLQVEGEKAIALYRYREDSLLQNNLINSVNSDELMELQKAFTQSYTNRMIKNQLKVSSHE